MNYADNLYYAMEVLEEINDWTTFTNNSPYWANEIHKASTL